MADVWMRHPSLPETQLIKVPASSVPQHQTAGWEVTEPPAKPKKPARPAPPAAAEADPEQDTDDGQDDEQPEPPDSAGPADDGAAKPKRTRKTPAKTSEES